MTNLSKRPGLPDLPTFARGPFYVQDDTLWICGTDEFGDMCHVADVRGWGYLTGRGQALALPAAEAFAAQQKTAEWIVAAMNEKMIRDDAEQRAKEDNSR